MSQGLSQTTFSQLVHDLADVEAFHHVVTVMRGDMIKWVDHLKNAAGPDAKWAMTLLLDEVPEKHILYLGLKVAEYDLRAINRLVMEGLRHPKDELHTFEDGQVLFKEYS